MDFDWNEVEYYWEDDMLIAAEMYDGPGDYDEDDYPFDDEQYENFLDTDNQ